MEQKYIRRYFDRHFQSHAIPEENTLEWELFRRQCQREYYLYVQYANPDFILTHFHLFLCDKIQKFLENTVHKSFDALLLSVPPQHGKSFTVTETLPSWYVAKYAGKDVILASYQGRVAEDLNRPNRDKFDNYATKIFSNVRPNPSMQQAALWQTEVKEKTKKSGWKSGSIIRASGLEGGITKYGCSLYIIDDPIKSQSEADSDTIMNTLKKNFVGSVKSRIRAGGKLIVIQTRWTLDDIIGMIRDSLPEFVVEDINIPCECVDQEIDPLHRPVGTSLIGLHMNDPQEILDVLRSKDMLKDNDWLAEEKPAVIAIQGETYWSALYQGMPALDAGGLLKREFFPLYNPDAYRETDMSYFILSIDPAFTKTQSSDYVVIQGWALDHIPTSIDVFAHARLCMCVRRRMTFSETVLVLQAIFKQYPRIDEILMEEKANGSALIDVLQQLPHLPPIRRIKPNADKIARTQAALPVIRLQCLLLPDHTPHNHEFYYFDIERSNNEPINDTDLILKEFTEFPFAKHDDIVDATTQFVTATFKFMQGDDPPRRRKVYERYKQWTKDIWEDYELLSEQDKHSFVQRYGAPLEWREN